MDGGYQGVIPVMLMGTMSVGTALAVCLIFSSGVGRGAALFHIWSSHSKPSPASPCGVCGLMESWDLSSSIDETMDWSQKYNNKGGNWNISTRNKPKCDYCVLKPICITLHQAVKHDSCIITNIKASFVFWSLKDQVLKASLIQWRGNVIGWRGNVIMPFTHTYTHYSLTATLLSVTFKGLYGFKRVLRAINLKSYSLKHTKSFSRIKTRPTVCRKGDKDSLRLLTTAPNHKIRFYHREATNSSKLLQQPGLKWSQQKQTDHLRHSPSQINPL